MLLSNKNYLVACGLVGLVVAMTVVPQFMPGSLNLEGADSTFSYDTALDDSQDLETKLNILKQTEDELYNTYSTLRANNLLPSSDNNELKTKLIAQLENIGKIRIDLYKSLAKKYELYQHTVIDNTKIANDILDATDATKYDFLTPEEEKDKVAMNQRKIQLNTYYSKRYEYLTDVIKLSLFVIACVLVLNSLSSSELIPDVVYNTMLLIVLMFGGYFLGKKMFLMLKVDNMDFDKYDWKFKRPDAQ
jgi:hypothetical protein